MNNYEAQLLACLMHNKDLMYETKLKADYFTTKLNRGMFAAIKHLVIDLDLDPTLTEIYEIDPELPSSALSEISNMYASKANWKLYQQKIIDAYKKRKIENLLKKALATNQQQGADNTIATLEIGINDIHSGVDGTEAEPLGNHIPTFMDKMTERAKLNGSLEGLTTPWKTFNEYTFGLKKSHLYVIGARPSEGKTALALNMICRLGIEENIPVGFMSLESSSNEIIERILAIHGGLELTNILGCKLLDYEYKIITETCDELKKENIIICDKPNMKLSECISQAHRMKIKYNIQALFIDYLQIITPDINKKAKHEEVAHISLTLKNLSRQLELPIIVLSQLTRDAQGRRPHLGDFAESSQIEKDADCCILIYHKKDGENISSYLLFDKNRNGPKGIINMKFNAPKLSFREL